MINKILNIIKSCDTIEQLSTAEKTMKLAIPKIVAGKHFWSQYKKLNYEGSLTYDFEIAIYEKNKELGGPVMYPPYTYEIRGGGA